jgi:hypothetical protein
MDGVWTRNIFSLVTPAQVDENRINRDRKGKSLLSPTLLEATEVQPKNKPKKYFILFYFSKPPMQTKDLVSRYLYINLGK